RPAPAMVSERMERSSSASCRASARRSTSSGVSVLLWSGRSRVSAAVPFLFSMRNGSSFDTLLAYRNLDMCQQNGPSEPAGHGMYPPMHRLEETDDRPTGARDPHPEPD